VIFTERYLDWLERGEESGYRPYFSVSSAAPVTRGRSPSTTPYSQLGTLRLAPGAGLLAPANILRGMTSFTGAELAVEAPSLDDRVSETGALALTVP